MTKSPRETDPDPEPRRLRWFLYGATLFVLPLHTVLVDVGFSLKPLHFGVVALAGAQALEARRWPWDRSLTLGGMAMLGGVALSWRPDVGDRFFLLFLALGMAVLILLVLHGEWSRVGTVRSLEVISWSGLLMGATAVVVGVLATGVFGEGLVDRLSNLPLIHRVTKEGYLVSGFVAITNWHQDPGYAAAWANLWIVFAALSWVRRRVTWKLIAVGLLAGGVVLTLSRTGWAALALAVPLGVYIGLTGSIRERVGVLGRIAAISVPVAVAAVGLVWAVDPPGVDLDLDRSVEFRLEQAFTLGTIEGLGIEGDIDGEADTRAEAWPRYAAYFRENPLRGAGLGTGWATGQEPHNLALQLLGETGLVGAAGFLVMAWVVVRRSSRLGWSLFIVAVLPGLTQTVLFEPTIWLAAAAAVAEGDETQ